MMNLTDEWTEDKIERDDYKKYRGWEYSVRREPGYSDGRLGDLYLTVGNGQLMHTLHTYPEEYFMNPTFLDALARAQIDWLIQWEKEH
jgi:hypothetical protein